MSFFAKNITDNFFKNSIEIGFAFGISTLAITEAVANNSGYHFVIDKFEEDHWGGNGLDLIEQAGLSNKLQFCNKYCYEILPQLLAEKKMFDFAYIDSTKQFDWILVDFFFLDKILNIGGVIVFDDANFPGIRKLLRYICQFPGYKIYESFPNNYKPSLKRKILNYFKYLPKASYFIREDIITSDFKLGINSGCVAIKKIAIDNRNWDWHVEF